MTCLFIYGTVLVIRTVAEFYRASLSVSHWWNNLFLPLIPLLIGAVLGLAPLPVPEGITTAFARCLFGFVCGMLSTIVFRAINAVAQAFITNKLRPDSDVPRDVDLGIRPHD